MAKEVVEREPAFKGALEHACMLIYRAFCSHITYVHRLNSDVP